MDTGVRVGNSLFKSFAYADDITLFNPTVTGLQKLIDVCNSYSKKWRFTFGIKKSKCMISNRTPFACQPKWLLGNQPIQIVDNLNIL